MFRIAHVPRERVKFFASVDRALESAKADAVSARCQRLAHYHCRSGYQLVCVCHTVDEQVRIMDGWSIRRRDAFTAFCILTSVHDQMLEYLHEARAGGLTPLD